MQETKKIVLPEGSKGKVKYIIADIGSKVPADIGIKKGMRVIMKPHTYITGVDFTDEFVLIDYVDIWGIAVE